MFAHVDRRTAAAVTLTISFWASAFAGIRVGLTAYTPGHLALLRFLVASSVLAIYAAAKGVRLPDRRDLPLLAVSGFLGITVYHVALSWGEISVTAGAASFLIALAPLFTVLMAVVFLKERLARSGWTGIFLSFFGVVLIAWGEGQAFEFDAHAFLILLSAVSTSIYFTVQKPLLEKYSPVECEAYAIWFGTLFMLVFAPGLPSQIAAANLGTTLAVVYLGVFPAAAAYFAWSYVLSKVPASKAAGFLYLSPPTANLIAWVWLGEVPTFHTLVGGTMAVAGVILANRGAARSRSSSATDRDPS